MATEFEVTISGTGKNLLNTIGILAEHGVNLNTITTTRNGNGYNVRFITGDDEATGEPS